jgi:hypothetical protein
MIRWDEDLLHLLATSVDHEAQSRVHEQKKIKKRSNPCRVPGCALTGTECVLYIWNQFNIECVVCTYRKRILNARHTLIYFI